MADSRFDEKLYGQILDFKPKKSDLRKIAIVEAVIDCIGREGIDNTTAQSVGKLSKMRRSHVAYYFPNRDAMVEAAIKYVVATSQEINVAYLLPAKGPREKLIAYVTGTFSWLERFPRHAPVMILLQYYGTCLPRYRKLHSQIRDAAVARIEAILVSSPAKKGKGKQAAHAASQSIRSVLVGRLTDFFSTEPPTDYETLKQQTIEAICGIADEYWS